ncbi:NUDIX domain-containing protein [Histidinibacterium lentulum]|uniref:NUDIX domain-containing protein n=1 Tax=Histidinibacterium lentulum TaxID=2480588 RepID=A0A3N2QL53_9RHOB|nr:NUDIX domain-containing protein [Histidinibacterium lentulum]
MTDPGVPVRDAATIIVLRETAGGPAVLMGRRGASAAFMPSHVVFPGGAVDPGDAAISLAGGLNPTCAARLAVESARTPNALAAAAIRELWEETGQIAGRAAPWPDAPRGWRGFARTRHRPDASGLTFVFRAITPPGRPRRFDARFFTLDANRLASDLDDFSRAEDELGALSWVPLDAVQGLRLPFITSIVLAELRAGHGRAGPPTDVPFYRDGAEEAAFRRIHGRA